VRTLVILCLILLGSCDQSRQVVISGNTMGTTYTVKIIAVGVDEEHLKTEVETRLQQINNLMSTYIPESELSRFNLSPAGEWFHASPETLSVLRMAADIYQLSEGSFDVTVGPLVNLWGFGPNPGPDQVPAAGLIAETLAGIGFRHLQISEDALRKNVSLYVDLSAIAKGYAVDELARLLESHDLQHYLVEIGGELRGKGINAQGKPWRVAVELPASHQRMPFRVVELDGMAMATSGDYRNYFEREGVRYSHTIDPATGYPITHNLASVTVLASSTALADGLATAINVMGAERGLALAEAQALAVFVILKQENGFEARYSTAFAPYLKAE
jgi:FAD:protein FMN transferase